MDNQFQIPALNSDDKITKKDIRKDTFRITEENKAYFPDESCNIQIDISNRNYRCSLICSKKKDKPYLLNIGEPAMQSLTLVEGDTISIKKMGQIYITAKNE